MLDAISSTEALLGIHDDVTGLEVANVILYNKRTTKHYTQYILYIS